MYSANLDLLRAVSSHHPDGRPLDPHAHHRAEVGALARAARHQVWQDRLTRWRTLLVGFGATEPQTRPSPDHAR